jgi:ABC transport system ATP-binding/permease protein
MSEGSRAPSVAPEPVVTLDGADRTLRAALYRVGRDPEADIVVSDSRVSWNHAALRAEGDVWLVEDRGSRNGTFVGSDRVALVAWWRLIQISPGRTWRPRLGREGR